MLFSLFAGSVFALLSVPVKAQNYAGPEDPRLTTQLVLEVPTNGVSTTTDGRTFLVLQHIDGSTGAQVVEYNKATNVSTPFPNKEWNSYATGKDPATHFVGANSQRIGPDGDLYVVDKGSAAFGSPALLPDGPKLIQINLKTNKVTRTYHLGNVTRSSSLLDDVRFHSASAKAYLTDGGSPGLIVLDLESGDAVRVLDNHISTKEYMPLSAEGQIITTQDGPLYVYADQLEVSPDGKYLYYQPASGGMSRIATKWLDKAFDDPSLNTNANLGSYVVPYAGTPSTGGTAIDAEGNIYTSDVNSQRIIKIAPNGTMTTLVQDPRLTWVDAMWVDDEKRLWMPATQLNRGTPFHNGTSLIQKPVYVYTIDIGVGPSRIDHA